MSARQEAQARAIERRIRELVATAPKVTPAQASRLALLLQRPATGVAA